MLNNADRSFKVKFNSSINSFSKIGFNRTENTFKPKAAASATTVPIRNTNTTTVITSKTHSITDNGHTHTI